MLSRRAGLSAIAGLSCYFTYVYFIHSLLASTVCDSNSLLLHKTPVAILVFKIRIFNSLATRREVNIEINY